MKPFTRYFIFTYNDIRTIIVYEESPDDGATAPANAVMNTLQDTLGLVSQVLWGVVGNVRTASSPHCSVGDTCNTIWALV